MWNQKRRLLTVTWGALKQIRSSDAREFDWKDYSIGQYGIAHYNNYKVSMLRRGVAARRFCEGNTDRMQSRLAPQTSANIIDGYAVPHRGAYNPIQRRSQYWAKTGLPPNLYAMPARTSLIGTLCPASAESVGPLTKLDVPRLVYRYSIRPKTSLVKA
jgi:hypothetical protein